MTNVWCVRADWGTFTRQFRDGGYVGIGWEEMGDLTDASDRADLYPRYRAAYPMDTSNVVIGQQVGQAARFLFELAAGDVVITPDANTELLWHGELKAEPKYIYAPDDPACRYPHRRPVKWDNEPLLRSSLSIPLQYTLRSSLTVFAISQRDEVLRATGHPDKVAAPSQSTYNPYEAVLRRLLELDAKEFELLVSELLRALGFEGSEHTGRTGDGGVDARGELNVGNLAKVKIFVQAKRYRLGTRIAANTVRQLRQSIPSGAQGAFVTTADFHKDAFAVALETGFPRIGLINGSQLVDLLVLHWEKLGDEFRVRLGLKPGLVPA